MARSMRFSIKGMFLATLLVACFACYVATDRTQVKERTYATTVGHGKALLMQYGVSRRRFGGEDYLQYLIINTSAEPWKEVETTTLNKVEKELTVEVESPSAVEACPIYEVVDGMPRFDCRRRIKLDEFEKGMASQRNLTLEDVCGMGDAVGDSKR